MNLGKNMDFLSKNLIFKHKENITEGRVRLKCSELITGFPAPFDTSINIALDLSIVEHWQEGARKILLAANQGICCLVVTSIYEHYPYNLNNVVTQI